LPSFRLSVDRAVGLVLHTRDRRPEPLRTQSTRRRDGYRDVGLKRRHRLTPPRYLNSFGDSGDFSSPRVAYCSASNTILERCRRGATPSPPARSRRRASGQDALRPAPMQSACAGLRLAHLQVGGDQGQDVRAALRQNAPDLRILQSHAVGDRAHGELVRVPRRRTAAAEHYPSGHLSVQARCSSHAAAVSRRPRRGVVSRAPACRLERGGSRRHRPAARDRPAGLRGHGTLPAAAADRSLALSADFGRTPNGVSS
jgi:hypothetical protein